MGLFSILGDGRIEQRFQHVGRLTVGEPAAEVAVLGHADLGMTELIVVPT
jgi:hypothetical protein